jgi:hypothetical protein
MRERCAEHGVAERAISEEQLVAMRAAREEYARRWKALGVGETIEIEVRLRGEGR